MPETITFSAKFAVIGILIVFSALALITVVVSLIRRADDSWQEHEKHKENLAYDKDQNIDTTTLIIISAAAATMLQGRYHIRSVRRLLPHQAAKSPWSVQGRAILLGSHVIQKRK